jgi:YVTN family beta-propeller protein
LVGTKLYVTNKDSNDVTVIDTTNDSPIIGIGVDVAPVFSVAV